VRFLQRFLQYAIMFLCVRCLWHAARRPCSQDPNHPHQPTVGAAGATVFILAFLIGFPVFFLLLLSWSSSHMR
jgi:hypothetical protein